MTDRIINKLPSKTWSWLKVNETRLPWDTEHTVMLPEEDVSASDQPVRFSLKGLGEYSRQDIRIHAGKGEKMTIYMDLAPENKLAVHTGLVLEEGAQVRLFQLQHSGDGSLLYNSVQCLCEKNACLELIQIHPGKGDLYSDTSVNLVGDGSSFQNEIGYMGKGEQILDMNEVVNHIGKATESNIRVEGSLQDYAKKTFKGTIDFKTGASDSVGNEQETVLMLGEEVGNITVPVILCAEENVIGNHGATIGELDEDTLFYLASRGISRQQAEDMMSKAGIERLKSLITDEKFGTLFEQAIE